MSSNPMLDIQQQVRENSDELQDFIRDMGSWQKEMEAKDRQLKNAAGTKTVKEEKQTNSQSKVSAKKPKLIEETSTKEEKPKTFDYSSWDKFDVDKALREIGGQDEDEDEDEDSEDEFLLAQRAVVEKDKGNEYFKKGDYNKAIDCYTKGIQLDPANAVLPANRAMALLKNGQAGAAEADCTVAIRLDTTYVKAYHRRANARVILQKYNEATEDFNKVLQYEPNNKVAKVELEKLKEKIKIKDEKPVGTIPVAEKTWSFEENLKKSFSKTSEPNKKDVKTPTDKSLTDKSSSPSVKLDSLMPEMIMPVDKKPHQRSKKPMHRIEIVDVDEDEPEIFLNIDDGSSTSQKGKIIEMIDSPVKKVDTQETVSKKAAVINADLSAKKAARDLQKKVEEEILESLSNEKKVDNNLKVIKFTTPPKTSVQFLNEWNQLKSVDNRSDYLQLLPNPVKDYSRIFRHSMESNIFTAIVEVLKSTDIPHKARHILGLSRVPRMSAIAMFLDSTDKTNLDKLIESLKVDSEMPSLTSSEFEEITKVFE